MEFLSYQPHGRLGDAYQFIDKNNDGKITKDELDKAKADKSNGVHKILTDEGLEKFTQLFGSYANGDGALNRQEYNKLFADNKQEFVANRYFTGIKVQEYVFGTLDKDRNGVVTRQEVEAILCRNSDDDPTNDVKTFLSNKGLMALQRDFDRIAGADAKIQRGEWRAYRDGKGIFLGQAFAGNAENFTAEVIRPNVADNDDSAGA